VANPFLNLAGFKQRSTMPSTAIDTLERLEPGWLDLRLDGNASWIFARLRKRYAVTWAVNPPLVIISWLVAITTLDAYLKRGFDPTSEQDLQIQKMGESARAEVLEAADSVTGLFDLPLLEGGADSAINQGGPFAYSEQSPYTWADVQAEAGRSEDASGR
jgi:hypothetical protein